VAVVRLADARTAELVRAGDHVDLLAPSQVGGPGHEVAHRSLVLPATGRGAKPDSLCSVAGDDGATLVLAVSANEALALSESSGSAGMVAVVVP
jgi:hypothetical protein